MSNVARILLLLLALGLAAPSASAVFVPSHSFEGNVAPVSFGEGNGTMPELSVFTGAVEGSGASSGLYVVNRAIRAVVTAGRAEVVDTSRNVTTAIAEYYENRVPLYSVFENATITFTAGSTFFLYTSNTVHDFSVSSPFALGLPVAPPSNFTKFEGLEVGASLALMGETGLDLVSREGPDLMSLLYSVSTTTSFNASGDSTDNGTFDGTKWLVRLHGPLTFEGVAETVLVPFETDGNVTFRPAKSGALKEGMDLERFGKTLQELQGKDAREAPSVVDDKTQEIIDQMAPLLNGAFIGSPKGNLSIEGKNRTGGFITILRYTEARLTPNGGTVAYEGSGRFLLGNNQLYTEKSSIGGAYAMPVLALVLWVFAVIAVIVGFTMKPVATPKPSLMALPLRLIAIIFHAVCFILLFILWDLEIRAFLGTSILSGNATGTGFAPVAMLQLIPMSLAALFFGLPVRFIVNGVLRLMNLKVARGVGKGVGNLATWGLGAAFIPTLLNPVLQLVLSKFS